ASSARKRRAPAQGARLASLRRSVCRSAARRTSASHDYPGRRSPVMSDDATELVVVKLSRQALDDIPLGVLRVSLDGRVLYLNQTARALAGPGLTIGTPLHALHFQARARPG